MSRTLQCCCVGKKIGINARDEVMEESKQNKETQRKEKEHQHDEATCEDNAEETLHFAQIEKDPAYRPRASGAPCHGTVLHFLAPRLT